MRILSVGLQELNDCKSISLDFQFGEFLGGSGTFLHSARNSPYGGLTKDSTAISMRSNPQSTSGLFSNRAGSSAIGNELTRKRTLCVTTFLQKAATMAIVAW
jgi:hypothetical protein